MDEWVDRSPKKSKAMRVAYDGLAIAEAWLREVHAEEDYEAQLEGIAAVVEWHAEIGRVAQEERR